MKGKKMTTSIGIIEFDANGVADIKDENYVASLMELDGFELADGEQMPEKVDDNEEVEVPSEEEESPQETEEETAETPAEEEASEFSEEALADKNVPQLRKIAKDNNIDLAGASKKDEIVAIIIGAMSK